MDTLYKTYRAALSGAPMPAAFVDLDRFDRNLDALARRARGTPIRLATKSIRCRALLKRALAHPSTAGLMCFRGWEAVFLHEQGFNNLLVAYPTIDSAELDAVSDAVLGGAHIVLTVDALEHVERLEERAEIKGTQLNVCLDIDMASRFGSIHFGVQRSPLRTEESVVMMANRVRSSGRLKLVGILTYEAQIAGLPDRGSRGSTLAIRDRGLHLALRALKARSIHDVRKRRNAIIAALRAAGHPLEFVNGGGTGSLESTAEDESVTEVSAGSGLFGPTLFDRYAHFKPEPAAGFALAVVRKPAPNIVTCFGGGYIASGSAGADRLPTPWLPRGAELLSAEGAGEVQTPIQLPKHRPHPTIGDPIFFRHAKAGELLEHFNTVHLIQQGTPTTTASTYRGDTHPPANRPEPNKF